MRGAPRRRARYVEAYHGHLVTAARACEDQVANPRVEAHAQDEIGQSKQYVASEVLLEPSWYTSRTTEISARSIPRGAAGVAQGGKASLNQVRLNMHRYSL